MDDKKPNLEMSQDELEVLAKEMGDLCYVMPASPVEIKLASALERICWHLSQRP